MKEQTMSEQKHMETMNENEFWLGVWVIIAVMVISIAGIIAVGVVINNKNAFENGYERIMLPGSDLSHWQKAKCRGQTYLIGQR